MVRSVVVTSVVEAVVVDGAGVVVTSRNKIFIKLLKGTLRDFSFPKIYPHHVNWTKSSRCCLGLCSRLAQGQTCIFSYRKQFYIYNKNSFTFTSTVNLD